MKTKDLKPSVSLEVFNKPYNNNHGKTFKILNNHLTLPHDVDHVYVEFKGSRAEAKIGTYRKHNTLRGTDTIRTLIAENHWQPGTKLKCEFIIEEKAHNYKII